MIPTTRVFWRRMIYGCKDCGYEVPFLLEDGCEGPRDGAPVQLVLREGPRAGEAVPVDRTMSGRLVVPVPFDGGRCPQCPGSLLHVRWNEDRVLDPPLVIADPESPWFEYPSASVELGDQYACGIPHLT